MTDCKVECHWHAVFTLVDVLSAGIVLTHIICLVSMKLWSIQCNVQNGTVVKYWHVVFGDSFHCKSFCTSNLPSNNVIIEPSTPKSFEIICFPKASFTFHSWDRIHDKIVKGPLAMFWTKIGDVPKETVKCNWYNKNGLNDHPPKTSGVTQNCNPW